MKEEEKIFAGQFFCPGHPDLKAIKLRCHNLCSAYNATLEDETEKRNAIVHQIFGDFGEGSFVQGPIQIHYGTHTHIGKSFFGNFNLTIQDDAPVTIGDRCNFGQMCIRDRSYSHTFEIEYSLITKSVYKCIIEGRY